MRNILLTSLILTLLISTTTLAKRGGPQDVEPVIYDGVKYVAVHWGFVRKLEQNGGYVEAFDQRTGKQLWRIRVYMITYDGREKDVQDVFITKLGIEQGRLIVTNEKGEKFSVDLKMKTVKKIK